MRTKLKACLARVLPTASYLWFALLTGLALLVCLLHHRSTASSRKQRRPPAKETLVLPYSLILPGAHFAYDWVGDRLDFAHVVDERLAKARRWRGQYAR